MVPDGDEELLRGLTLDELYPPYAVARRASATADRRLADGLAEAAARDQAVARAAEDVRAGRVVADVMRTAMADARAAHLAISALEVAAADARQEEAAARDAARERALEEVQQRLGQIRRADAVLVNALDALDRQYDALVARLSLLCRDEFGQTPARFDLRGATGTFPVRCEMVFRSFHR